MSKIFFKTIEELLKHLPINSQNDLEEFEGQLLKVHRTDLYPVFGKVFVNEILDIYNGSTPITGDIAEIVELFQVITGSIGVANWTYFKNVDMSTFMTEREDQSFKAAKQWRVDDLRDYLYNQGNNAIDDALELIETSSESEFEDYKNSDYFKKIKISLIDSINVFNDWHNINKSRRVFMLLRPNIQYIEEFQIKPLLEPVFDKLKEGEYKPVLTIVQAMIVKRTIVKATDLNVLNFTDTGIRIRTRQGESQNKISEAEKDAKAQLVREAQEEADFLYKSVLTELNKNASATKYKEWFESSFYKPEKSISYENECTDKIYMA